MQDSKRRVDLLALDRSGALVVIELKRTEDGGHLTAVGVGCWSRTRADRRSELKGLWTLRRFTGLIRGVSPNHRSMSALP
jgi:RecB family endonuclease NucS